MRYVCFGQIMAVFIELRLRVGLQSLFNSPASDKTGA